MDTIERFLKAQPPDAVLVQSVRSPDGWPAQWEATVPDSQWVWGPEGFASPEYVTVSDTTDGIAIDYCPPKSQHWYVRYGWAKAGTVAAELIATYTGNGVMRWDRVTSFGEWLKSDMGLDAGGEEFAACMRAALTQAIGAL